MLLILEKWLMAVHHYFLRRRRTRRGRRRILNYVDTLSGAQIMTLVFFCSFLWCKGWMINQLFISMNWNWHQKFCTWFGWEKLSHIETLLPNILKISINSVLFHWTSMCLKKLSINRWEQKVILTEWFFKVRFVNFWTIFSQLVIL